MHHLKIATRQLKDKRTYTLITVFGLATSFIVSLVIFSFVHYHYSFDKNVDNSERSYCITTALGDGAQWAATFAAFNKPLKNNQLVEKSTVFFKHDVEYDILLNNVEFHISDPVFAEPDFIDFFNIELKMGKPDDLNTPNSVLISDKCAKALFNEENPIGKSIKITGNLPNNYKESTVVGVIAPKQKKTHLEYDFIHSKKGFFEGTESHLEGQKVYGAYVYLTLKPNIPASELESQLEKMITPALGNSPGPQLEDFKHTLQPYKDIHFTTGYNLAISTGVKKSMLYILLIVGSLLFLTALLNFLIMNIARAEGQLGQMRIFKSLGSSTINVLKLPAIEAAIIVVASLLLASLGLLALNKTIGSQYFTNWQVDFHSVAFWVILLLLGVLSFSISLLISSGSILKSISLKAKTHSHGDKKMVPLIILQFTIVIGLISYSFLLNKQIRFIETKDLGYNSENVMVLRVNGRRSEKINLLKERVKKVPGVIAAANAQHYPGFRLMDVTLETKTDSYPFKFAMVDEDAMELLDIEIVEQLSETDKMPIYINETMYNSMLKKFTIEEIMNGDFNSKQQNGPEKMDFYVNGVIKDFHYSSLYNPLGNFSFFIRRTSEFNHRFLMVRYNQNALAEIRNSINDIATDIYGTAPLETSFLNESLNKEYEAETQLLSVSKLFSILTVIIANMGLIAFTLFFLQKRTKEIGIRKVNGARVSEIIGMLNNNFVVWISIAFVLAIPAAWFAMNKWLENFAFKTAISWWIFVLAGIITLAIALLTVSWQSWRAATRNPVEALRYE